MKFSWEKRVRNLLGPLWKDKGGKDKTRVSQHIAFFDGLRSVGFLWIISVHATTLAFLYAPDKQSLVSLYVPETPLFLWLTMAGHFAMELFFMMSGFLLTLHFLSHLRRVENARSSHHNCDFLSSLLQDVIEVAKFSLNRLVRFIPSYFVFLLVFLLPPNIPHRSNSVWNFLFVNNLVDFKDQFCNHTWSIGVEGQVAFILPFLLHLILKTDPTRPHSPVGEAILPAMSDEQHSNEMIQRLDAALRRLGWIILLTIGWKFASVVYLDQAYGITLPYPVMTFDWMNQSLSLPLHIQKFYQLVYLPTFSRFSSHLIGSFLCLFWIRSETIQPLSSLKCAVDSMTSSCARFSIWFELKVISAFLSCGLAIFLLPLTNAEGAQPYLPQWLQVVSLALSRPLFCGSIACLCFWALTSSSANPRSFLLSAFKWMMESKFFFPIARISYSGYLWHIPMIAGTILALKKLATEYTVVHRLLGSSLPNFGPHIGYTLSLAEIVSICIISYAVSLFTAFLVFFLVEQTIDHRFVGVFQFRLKPSDDHKKKHR